MAASESKSMNLIEQLRNALDFIYEYPSKPFFLYLLKGFASENEFIHCHKKQ